NGKYVEPPVWVSRTSTLSCPGPDPISTAMLPSLPGKLAAEATPRGSATASRLASRGTIADRRTVASTGQMGALGYEGTTLPAGPSTVHEPVRGRRRIPSPGSCRARRGDPGAVAPPPRCDPR